MNNHKTALYYMVYAVKNAGWQRVPVSQRPEFRHDAISAISLANDFTLALKLARCYKPRDYIQYCERYDILAGHLLWIHQVALIPYRRYNAHV